MALRSWAMQLATYLNLYERQALAALTLLIKPGDCAIDVGANFGSYTRTLSKLVGQSGQIWAFEPIAAVFEQLRLRTQNMPNVKLFNLALSRQAQQELRLHIPLLAHGVPEPSLASIEQVPKPYQMITIQSDRLDNLTADLKALSFIKVDVEGHESAFLEGAVETIARFRPVIQFEENDLAQRFEWYDQFARSHKLELRYFERASFHSLDRPSTAPVHERNFYFFPI